MPVPKQRHTKSRRNRRRSHQALVQKKTALCPKCKSPVLPHRLCPNCGSYAGREVINVLAKLDKKERKKKEKEMSVQAQSAPAAEKGLNMEGLSKK